MTLFLSYPNYTTTNERLGGVVGMIQILILILILSSSETWRLKLGKKERKVKYIRRGKGHVSTCRG